MSEGAWAKLVAVGPISGTAAPDLHPVCIACHARSVSLLSLWFLRLVLDWLQGKTFFIRHLICRVGRDARSCDLVLSTSLGALSREHVVIEKIADGNKIMVQDNSKYGSKLRSAPPTFEASDMEPDQCKVLPRKLAVPLKHGEYRTLALFV